MGELFLLRHGETEWSRAGRHTGRTDLPLTAAGEDQARAAAGVLARLSGGTRFVQVLVSPLQRARRTAELAGLAGLVARPAGEPADGPTDSPTDGPADGAVDGAVEVDPDLVEWDYGGYEGLTTSQIRAAGHPGWRIFHDGVVPGATPGETLSQVAQRAERVLARAEAALSLGDVALVGHGHALRVLATVWLGRPADLAQQLLLGSGSVSVLGEEHDVPAVRAWNVST